MKRQLAMLMATIGLVFGVFAATLDIGTVQCGYVMASGWILTGTLESPYRIAIQDGATVTISNMVINLDSSGTSRPGLTCEGDATIILKGTNTISSIGKTYPGISVPAGKTLTIRGDGSLTAIGKERAAAIGGGTNAPCGNIVIESGTINATGGYLAAGIGSGLRSSCGNITINGGVVTATGGDYAAAIGGGCSGSCCDITINGGRVVANGPGCAPGIGSGDDGSFHLDNSCGDIAINGGIVTSTGGINAPGIGNGRASRCGNIYIGPGIIRVIATAGKNGQPIGRAASGTCGTVTVDSHLHSSISDNTRTITSNTIDLSIVDSDTTIYSGYTLTGELAARRKISIAPGSVVTLSNVVINGVNTNLKTYQWAGLNCLGDTQIILVGDNIIRGFDSGYPGIHVQTNSALYILGGGSLTASSNGNAAGIGGGLGLPCGVVAIVSGVIDATGSGAPGIGGYACDAVYIFGGTVIASGGNGAPGIGGDPCNGVVVKGGDVIAYGGKNAAGIGGRYMGDFPCAIGIMGGNVTAYGGKNGAGIGSGCEGACGEILVAGGTVVAFGGDGACGIGFGTYGNCSQVGFANGLELVEATCGDGGTPIAMGSYGSPDEPIVDDGLVDDHGDPMRTIQPAPPSVSVIFDAQGGKFSNGAATKTVEAPPGNLWGKMPMPSKSGQVFDGWYTAASGGTIVTASSKVPGASATYYAHWTPRLGLAAASEWSGEFTTESWCGQGTVAHDGKDALRSGIVYDNQSSYLITKVTGPGTLTFWWSVSCEGGGKDALRLLVDGAQVAMISGDVDWTKVEVPITGTGTHTIKWNYTKNGSVTKGEDFGWVDQISWAATPAESAFVFDANGGKFSNGATVKKTDATPGNLWGKMYMPAKDSQVFVGWYTAPSGGSLVTSSSVVPDYYTTYYAHWTPRLGLAAASEWSGAFETDSWCGQGAVSHDGKDALRSGIIYDNQSSYILTRVTGPGTFTFWWKVSSEGGGNDKMRFLVDAVQKSTITGENDWAKVTVDVTGSGTHIFKWVYSKNGSVTKGQDFAWLDQLSWTAK